MSLRKLRENGRERESVCVCVCVCVIEKERDRMRRNETLLERFSSVLWTLCLLSQTLQVNIFFSSFSELRDCMLHVLLRQRYVPLSVAQKRERAHARERERREKKKERRKKESE